MEMLRTLYRAINNTTSERTASLHERFSKPVPCKAKENLAVSLRQWQEDLQELQAVDSAPSKETILASLKMMVSPIRELKVGLEMM